MSRWRVLHIGEKANGYGFWSKSHLEDTGLYVRIIFKWILFRDSLVDIVTRLQAGRLRNND